MENRFQKIIRSVMNTSAEDLDDDPACDALGQWNSLQHVQLVAAVEDAYRIRLSPREIRSFRTVGGLRQILTSKGITT